MKLYIKHMSAPCCHLRVQAEMTKLGLTYGLVTNGVVEMTAPLTAVQHYHLKLALLALGLELLDSRKARLLEQLEAAIAELVRGAEARPRLRNSAYLSHQLHYDYTYLANVYSEATGRTIEQAIIAGRIERVKQALLHGELNLTQISHQLHYSSVAHLSAQFKKVTGLTPSAFKHLHHATPAPDAHVGMM